ncbi:hypothetical protein Misp01_45110 [Microtetraspora sp. NBRC 13810]|uniref:hypothetical protein n=1 Tax=Microtetraspora sp. NBRC 13810 TaxID=3030990 RepID=UPI0024A0AAB1|nr:hypothetical protein [Microtetraspora sp. NBRC 13810]GLW09382.1 hypothetical protein Misp01_45110 [Microtetraspora sp. NBRC 13810]
MRRRAAYLVLPVLLLTAGIGWLLVGGAGPGPVELPGRGAHYAVVVALRPGTGTVEARVEIAPAAPAEVSLFAVMPHMGHTTPEIAARRDGAGHYVARGELFTMPGAWEIGIRVRGPSGTEVIKVNTLVGEQE